MMDTPKERTAEHSLPPQGGEGNNIKEKGAAPLLPLKGDWRRGDHEAPFCRAKGREEEKKGERAPRTGG